MGDGGRRVRLLWRALWRSKQLEDEMHEEMQFHIQMEAERLRARNGVDPREARRLARISFGGIENYKEEAREARGFRWLDSLSLDARLASRMLIKHRWLALVGAGAMAIAIAISASTFILIGVLLDPALPFVDGDRIVSVKYSTTSTGKADRRVLHAFAAWRARLTSIDHLSAFRTARHNLVVANAAPEPVRVAEITASAFVLAQTPPLIGRYLLASDERPGAARVVVIGYDAWRTRLGADRSAVGRTVQLAGTAHTVVGVMPAGFGFPIDHQFWIPLQLDPLQYQPWQGPELHLFGRLARGATIEQAQAELAITGRPFTDSHPDGEDRVRPVTLPFTREHLELTQDTMLLWALTVARWLVGALSFVVAINLAALLYARTLSRLGELSVRAALGASRTRILSQLFVEALALTAVGAAAGLTLCALALQYAQWLADTNGGMPFWIRFELSVASLVYVAALAILTAVIMGVLPGLKVIGTPLSALLQELHGRTTTRLGPIWTTLIVAQVAVAVAILPAAVHVSWHVVKLQLRAPSIAVQQLVVANLAMSDDSSATAADRLRERQHAVISRLREEPGVAAVTFSSAVPGMGGDTKIEFETFMDRAKGGSLEVETVRVDVNLFQVYGARVLTGRGFDSRDIDTGTAVVNRTFVTELTGRVDALGLRFRRPPRPELYEIVGVVDDFPGFPRQPGSQGVPTVYFPAALGELPVAILSLRFSDTIPADVAGRLRRIAAEIDPAMQLQRVVPMSTFNDELRSVWRAVAWAVLVVMLSVLLLSAAGVHALMSFAIAQRTREIGIRSALGAPPRRLLFSVFGRVLRQLSVGVLGGSLLSVIAFAAAGVSAGTAAVLLVAAAALMTGVALLAALAPAWRTLRLPAIEALRC